MEPSLSSSLRSGVPLWFSQGHIRDDLAKQAQLGANSVKFLSTRLKPELGMRTETSIHALDGTTFRMTGVITAVGGEPSVDQLAQSDSLLWRILAAANPISDNDRQEQNEHATAVCLPTRQDKKEFLSNFLGCVHGQRITSIATVRGPLVVAGSADDLMAPPLTNDAAVEMTFKFHDSMYYPWEVETFRVLTAEEVRTFSPAFVCELYHQVSCASSACPRCCREPKPATDRFDLGGGNPSHSDNAKNTIIINGNRMDHMGNFGLEDNFFGKKFFKVTT